MNFNTHLTQNQYRQFSRGGSIQLSPSQLLNKGALGHIPMSINLNDMGIKKVQRALKQNKGVRLAQNLFTGGSILGSIRSTFSKAGDAIKKTANQAGRTIRKTSSQANNVLEEGLNQAGNQIVRTTNQIARTIRKQDWGGYIQKVKNAVPKEVLQIMLNAAMEQAGVDPKVAEMLSTSSVDSFYAVDFSKKLQGQGDEALAGAVSQFSIQDGINNAVASQYGNYGNDASTGYGFLSSVKKGLSKGAKAVGKSKTFNELKNTSNPILRDMANEEIAKRHMDMADRYGDNRLASALLNKSADIAYSKVNGGAIVAPRGYGMRPRGRPRLVHDGVVKSDYRFN